MIFSNQVRAEVLKSLADVQHTPFWLDDPSRPQPAPCLSGDTQAGLAVIGGGFTGLWTALLAKEANPGLDIVLIEASQVGSGASGRNGGFCAASLTHNFENGRQRWPHELAQLTALGHANLDAIEAAVNRLGIDCEFIRSGEITVALEPYQVEEMQRTVNEASAFGEAFQWWDAGQVRARVNSPTYLGGMYNPNLAMLNPARLAWGLRKACLELGVRLYENTPAKHLEQRKNYVDVHTTEGRISARQVALATNAFPPLLKQLADYVVPVYDYALMSEPLSPAQRSAIGWQGRQGVADAGNQFHYYRITAGGRILWGGYDALYHWNNGFGSQLEVSQVTFTRLAGHFFQTFPQLEGLRFSHAWGGAIDTCSRFTSFWGLAHGGRSAYALGYTGLGVGAARFAAQVMLDLLNGQQTGRTSLEMVRSKPIPFPPEPLRSLGIQLTRWSLAQADRHAGRRNLWLRLLDRLGMGFDS